MCKLSCMCENTFIDKRGYHTALLFILRGPVLHWLSSCQPHCSDLHRRSEQHRARVRATQIPYMYCFSKHLVPKPPDWGANIDITGAPPRRSEPRVSSGAHASSAPPAAQHSRRAHAARA